MCLVGLNTEPHGPDKTLVIGEFLNWTIRVMLLINGLYVTIKILKAIKQKLYKECILWKLSWKRSTQFQGSSELIVAMRGITI